MHELTTLRAALERALLDRPRTRDVDVMVRIRDARTVTGDAARLYLDELLRERHFSPRRLTISIDCAKCRLCDWTGIPIELDPTCPRCGMPLPGVDGPPVVVRLTPARRRAPRERRRPCA
jgi:hypothetical protein